MGALTNIFYLLYTCIKRAKIVGRRRRRRRKRMCLGIKDNYRNNQNLIHLGPFWELNLELNQIRCSISNGKIGYVLSK